MHKSFIVSNTDELAQLEQTVLKSMDKAESQIKSEISFSNAHALFVKMKFGGVGVDPLDHDRELNVVEQINQSFTYLASFYALEILFAEYPQLAPFRLNLGTAAGSDIESECGELTAEVFASVTPTNNQKLKKDIDKVMETNAKFKFAFFMSPNYELGRQPQLEKGNVVVWALKGARAL